MSSHYKKITAFIVIVISSTLFYKINPTFAASPDELLWGGYRGSVQEGIGLGTKDPRAIVASLIKVVLGFMGILALCLIMLAGFKWMLSGGSEDKVSEAKGMLSQAVVGLLIILASFGIANFVIDALYEATGNVL